MSIVSLTACYISIVVSTASIVSIAPMIPLMACGTSVVICYSALIVICIKSPSYKA
jgi:hypothetical protein